MKAVIRKGSILLLAFWTFICISNMVVFGEDGGNHNLLANGSFESVNGTIPEHWSVINRDWNIGIHAAEEAAYTGTYGIVIATETSNKPWVMQQVPVEAGATYEVTSRYKSVQIQGNAGYKIEFYDKETDGELVGQSFPYIDSSMHDGQWHAFSYEVEAPPDAAYMAVYTRLYGKGRVYFDDVSVVKTKDPVELAMKSIYTDHTFYYPDLNEARVDVLLEPLDGSYSDKSIHMQMTNDSGDILFDTTTEAVPHWTQAFDPTLMETGSAYTLSLNLLQAGQSIEQQTKTIYRWERPAQLPDNGLVLVDGEPFYPVIGYHVTVQDYPYMDEIGVNTVQGIHTSDEGTMRTNLDAAHTNGLKVFVPLYLNMKVKENFEVTRHMVTTFKDHPAVLGWMIMDEPTYNGVEQQELLDAYKLIRTIDPLHPTYMVENIFEAYPSTGQATDILVTDQYPFNTKHGEMEPISTVTDSVNQAIAAVNGDKPVWTVLQTFRFPNSDVWDYLPTIEQVRNMAYQAILAGSKGIAYYSVNDPGWKLRESVLWQGLMQFAEEQQLIGRLVTEGHRIAESDSPVAPWGIWELDGEQYAVAVNISAQEQSVLLPLPQAGNKIETLYGGGTAACPVWTWENEAHFQLGMEQAIVYRITPFSSIVNAAEEQLQAMHDELDNRYWMARTALLIRQLEKLGGYLEGLEPEYDKAGREAAKALHLLSGLQDWVNKQGDDALNGKRHELLQAIAAIKEEVVPLARVY